ncbi:MAG: gas vesicle protein [Sulfuricella sp.]|nr:gas vesicle protein [Sulfuricella sp.]
MNAPHKPQRSMSHAVESATLADVLERILDKGLVIAGDIKIKIVDIELLTIQIRLLVCSVDKAREMGIDWWTTNPYLSSKVAPGNPQAEDLSARIARLEEALQQPPC